MNLANPELGQVVVCESEDRWTKLVRRQIQAQDPFRVIRVPGYKFLRQFLSSRTAIFVAIEIDSQNVEPIAELVRRSISGGKNHRFVGLCQTLDRSNAVALRCCGLDACYFSLTNVQSVIRLARRHFATLAKAAISNVQADSAPLDLLSGFWDRLPTFNR